MGSIKSYFRWEYRYLARNLDSRRKTRALWLVNGECYGSNNQSALFCFFWDWMLFSSHSPLTNHKARVFSQGFKVSGKAMVASLILFNIKKQQSLFQFFWWLSCKFNIVGSYRQEHSHKNQCVCVFVELGPNRDPWRCHCHHHQKKIKLLLMHHISPNGQKLMFFSPLNLRNW